MGLDAPGALPSRVAAAPNPASIGVYDRHRSIYNLKPKHLFRTRAKLAAARAGTGFCSIGFAAHSMAAGVGAVGGVSDFPTVFTKILAAAGYPLAGTGLVAGYRGSAPLDPRWNWGTGWGAFGGSTNLMTNSTTTNAAVFTSDIAGTVIRVYFAKTSSSGSYAVSIDGGAATTVTPGGGTNQVSVYQVTGLANTTHTVSIARNGAGPGFVFGVELRSATSGVRLYNGGLGGAKATIFAVDAFYSLPSFAANGQDVNNGTNLSWNSDLIVIGPIMANDALAAPATTTATWKAAVQAMITSARTTSAGSAFPADVVLMTDTPVAGTDLSGYRQAMYELADTNDVPLIDMLDRWTSSSLSNSYGLMSDGTHPNANGYAEWARALFSALAL